MVSITEILDGHVTLEVESVDNAVDETTDTEEKPVPLAGQRRAAILAALRDAGTGRVLDLGCGQGQLVQELLKDTRFTEIVGVDVSMRALTIASRRLKLDRMGERQAGRVTLQQGALTYTDKRLKGYDAATHRYRHIGAVAPDFELPAGPDGQTLSLKQFRGENVVLVFYPADFSPVCGDQVTLYNEILPEFEALRARTLGISVDSAWCHQAYAESRRLKFPLLSDFHPKGAVAQRYGAYDSAWGVAVRALFVIDGAGIIRWSYLSPIDVNPGADGILAALEEIEAKRVEVS